MQQKLFLHCLPLRDAATGLDQTHAVRSAPLPSPRHKIGGDAHDPHGVQGVHQLQGLSCISTMVIFIWALPVMGLLYLLTCSGTESPTLHYAELLDRLRCFGWPSHCRSAAWLSSLASACHPPNEGDMFLAISKNKTYKIKIVAYYDCTRKVKIIKLSCWLPFFHACLSWLVMNINI